MAKNGEDKE